MTIVFFCRLFYPHIGGVETHVLEVGKRLVREGHKVIVITEEISGKDIPVYQSRSSSAKVTGEVEGIKIHRIPVKRDSGVSFDSAQDRQNDGGKKFRIWWWLWQHKDLIKNADIVHCHDVFFWYLPFRFLFPNKPIFTTFHGYETKFPPSKKAILIRKISEWLSNGNICIGEYVKKWYGASSKYVTYGGVNIRNYHATVRGSYAKGIKILFIGRLEEDAGIPIYLRVMDVLKKRRVRFTFEACGDGSFRKRVERFGKVYGFVSDLAPYIKSSDFVFASSYLSILEAMAAKKMVFSVYGNLLKKDYLKMAPFGKWIIIENSPQRVVDKILYLTQHQKEREELVNKSYEWVEKQTWEKVTSMYVDLWRKPFRYSYNNTGSLQI